MRSLSFLPLYLLLGIVMMGGCAPKNESANAFTNPAVVEQRIDSLMALMTLEEKIGMIHASSSFTSGGVERLGIPELIMSDGPHGVRHEHGRDWVKDEGVADSSTYLPVGVALASTWNRDLGYQFGSVLGSEAAFRGKDIILGPGLNIIRSPLNGRNFEYLTEDPYLNAQMVVGYVKGVQDQGIAANAKHYVANTLEFEREYVDVRMDERTFREIYLPGFKAAVQEGGVYSVMAAYNKFRGDYVAQSTYLLDDVLKDELGFEGIVISDWNAVKSTLGAVRAGLDIEMGSDLPMLATGNVDYGNFHLGDTLLTLVDNGSVEEAWIDAKVRRILRVMHRIHKFDTRPPGAYNTPEHQAIARTIADEAIVLLKNDGVLPLRSQDMTSLAVVGANATRRHAGAGGSSQVKAYYEVTPLEGLQKLLGGDVTVSHAPGYRIERNGAADPDLIQEAVDLVSTADAAIYVGGLIHGYSDEWNDNAFDAEVLDKPDMKLPFGQDELIRAVLDANPNTIIVLVGGAPVDMRAWNSKAKGIVQAWYAGMEGGNALADILFGNVNPSGKLPMTFPDRLEDSPAHTLASYPDENLVIDHTEGVFVGYRYFDSYGLEPAFPFGHGLSYTRFAFSDLEVEKQESEVLIRLTLSNVGSRTGAEVVQVYVEDIEASVDRPVRELKAFDKVRLNAGESTDVTLSLDESAFRFFDEERMEWVLEPGAFRIHVGNSSANLPLSADITF